MKSSSISYVSIITFNKDHVTIIIEPIDHFVKLKIRQLQLFADSSNFKAINITRYTVLHNTKGEYLFTLSKLLRDAIPLLLTLLLPCLIFQ